MDVQYRHLGYLSLRTRRRGGGSKPGMWRAKARSPPGSTTVEVVLTPDGPDTVVELFHHELPAGEFDSHLEGWSAMLDRLVRLRM